MPWAGCAGGGVRARRRARTAAQHTGHAGIKRVFDLLRANPVNMRINAARGDDVAFAGDNFSTRTDDDIDTGLNIGVARLTNGGNATIANTDIGLDDAGVIKDQRIGDHGIDRAIGTGDL